MYFINIICPISNDIYLFNFLEKALNLVFHVNRFKLKYNF